MKNLLKKQVVTILAASMVLTSGAAYAESSEQAVVTSAPYMNTTNAYQVIVNDIEITTLAFVGNDKQIMVPLRETSEALGFKVIWHQDKQWAEVLKEGTPIWTLVQPKLDQYTYNRMNLTLGAAPESLAGRLYVPASFFNEILRGQVSYEKNQVVISTQAEEVKMLTQQAVITQINNEDHYKSLQINGIGMEGIILNIDENTVIRNVKGVEIALDKLVIGTSIEVKHSLAMTMSLPGQTYAYDISLLDEATELLGTAGSITEVYQDEQGNKRVMIQGTRITDQSQEQVVLNINEDTKIIDVNGNTVDDSKLMNDANVLVFYDPQLAKSLPPIGQAWKIVYLNQ